MPSVTSPQEGRALRSWKPGGPAGTRSNPRCRRQSAVASSRSLNGGASSSRSEAEPFLVQLLRWQAGLVQGRADGGHQAGRSADVDVPRGKVGDHLLQRGGGERVAPFAEEVVEARTAAAGDVLEFAAEDELLGRPGPVEEQQ